MKTLKYSHLPRPSFHPGVFSYVTTDVSHELEELYARPKSEPRLGLKVFTTQYVGDKRVWKNTDLDQATKIQNIFHLHGFAPRVIDVVTIETPDGKYLAQVTQIVEDDQRGKMDKELADQVHDMMKLNGIGKVAVDPNHHHDYIHHVVDFDPYYFTNDGEDYKKYLISRLDDEAGWGSRSDTYQSIEILGAKGQRDMKSRVDFYGLHSLNFQDKLVIDYGASGGEFVRYALKRGAKRAVGIDYDKVSNIAYEVSNWLEKYEADFYGGNFRHDEGNDVYKKIQRYTGLKQFDIIFYLSCQQLLMPDYIREILHPQGTFILEGHSGHHEETFRDVLEKDFDHVSYLGKSQDHGARPVFICQKPKHD